MNGYKIVLLKAILCFIGCRKVNGYAPEYVKDGELIVEVYEKLGLEVFENKKYQRAEIKKALDKYNTELFRFSVEVVQEVREAFPLNVPIPMDEIQSKLQNVYKRYGIDYKVKKNTIEDYYDVNFSYSKKPYTYTLKAIR